MAESGQNPFQREYTNESWRSFQTAPRPNRLINLCPRLSRIFFVTNNSTKSRKGYKKKFDSLGLVSLNLSFDRDSSSRLAFFGDGHFSSSSRFFFYWFASRLFRLFAFIARILFVVLNPKLPRFMYALQGLTNPVKSIPIVHEMIAYLDVIIAGDGKPRGGRGLVTWQRNRRVSFVSLPHTTCIFSSLAV